MNKVIHFEVHVDEIERAKKFYENVFDWKITKWETDETDMEYWMVMGGDDKSPGINGGMVKRQGPKPSDDTPVSSFVSTIDVKDLDETINKIEEFGGKITVPKMGIPKVGWLAYFKDTENNTVGIMQEDENATMK